MTPTLPTDHQVPGWGAAFVEWLTAFGFVQSVRSGIYISSNGPGGSSVALTQNRLALAPILLPSAVTFIEANIWVSIAAASNVVRAGIYTDDGNGAPASLVNEFGSTFDCSTTGTKTQTISVALNAGRYWVGGSLQGGTGASALGVGPGIAGMCVNSGPAIIPLPARAYYQDSVTGGLPGSFTFVLTQSTANCPLVTLKVS